MLSCKLSWMTSSGEDVDGMFSVAAADPTTGIDNDIDEDDETDPSRPPADPDVVLLLLLSRSPPVIAVDSSIVDVGVIIITVSIYQGRGD